MLQNTRKLLKQAHQQAMSSAVQMKLETSIKTLNKAHQFANLDSLKQSDEAFQSITITINTIKMWNKVNNALKAAKIDNLLVSTVIVSQFGAIIVFTTCEDTAKDLLKHQHVWKWYKLIADEISTFIFNTKEGMQLVKDEVKIFIKDIKLAVLPHWLISEEARQEKQHDFIVLTVKSEQELQKALRNRFIIAEFSVRTAIYATCKFTDQCKRCQKFEHLQTMCKNKETCQFCAENHNIRLHSCFQCFTQQKEITCAHTVYKCVNCDENHQANNEKCSVFKALQPISSTADSLVMKL